MSNRDSLRTPHKKLLPIDGSNYQYNFQSFQKNVSLRNSFQPNSNPSPPLSSSSSFKYNQFISDTPLNGPSKSENETNSSYNRERLNPTFFSADYKHDDYFEPEQKASDPSQSNEQEPLYENIALQAQQLLDKLNHNFQTPNIQSDNTQENSSHFNNTSEKNNGVSQSLQPPKLQPIIQSPGFFPNRSNRKFNSSSLNPPIIAFHNQNHFNSNYQFAYSNQFSQNQPIQNIPQKKILNQNKNCDNEGSQFPKPPQATFVTPDFINYDGYDPNMKRLRTASEMVYPDNHIELLQPSYKT